MNKVLNLTYASSLTDLCEVNSSFDTGILRIAYTGENVNKSRIDKQTFEKCIKSIYNCPIVCNYDRDTDTLGSHDIEVVRDKDGEMRLVNLTVPVGCIPESAKVFWENVTEDDGTEHEYLCAEALLWKRQEAYRKIKSDGCTAQSMEIKIKDGELVDGIFEIYDFEFTAFALIGVKPCFESAALEFSKQDFKLQFSEMMREIKESFKTVIASDEDNDISLTKGGEETLEEKFEIIKKYNLTAEDLDFSLEDITVEELAEKLKAYKKTEEPDDSKKFALESAEREELYRALSTETVSREWGEITRYCFCDYDSETSEVFAWDSEDWLLYGFTYKHNGDNIVVDFESKKRKKYVIADFDEGEQLSPFAGVYAKLEAKIKDNAEIEAKYSEASETIASMKAELEELRKFKSETEESALRAEKDALFAEFEDLQGDELFEALKTDSAKYDLEALEEKCFAIRGRKSSANFSRNPDPKPLKLKIEKEDTQDEPYGGLFRKYGH